MGELVHMRSGICLIYCIHGPIQIQIALEMGMKLRTHQNKMKRI